MILHELHLPGVRLLATYAHCEIVYTFRDGYWRSEVGERRTFDEIIMMCDEMRYLTTWDELREMLSFGAQLLRDDEPWVFATVWRSADGTMRAWDELIDGYNVGEIAVAYAGHEVPRSVRTRILGTSEALCEYAAIMRGVPNRSELTQKVQTYVASDEEESRYRRMRELEYLLDLRLP